jgi:hypothetical protein
VSGKFLYGELSYGVVGQERFGSVWSAMERLCEVR